MTNPPRRFQRSNRLLKYAGAPLSNKLNGLRYVYWRIKAILIYRLMFKRLGRRSVIYSPMLLHNADCIEIGDDVLIRDGARLESVRDPYGRTPRLVIGSNTNIEQNAHIVCHSRVTIGEGVSIAGHCSIVDVTHPHDGSGPARIGDRILDEDSYVEIGDGAFIGIGAVILPNVRIGCGAVVGANSVVTKDVPPYTVAAGVPAVVLRKYSNHRPE